MRLGKAPHLAGIVAIVGLAGTLAAAAPSAAARFAAPSVVQSPASVVLTASAAPALPAGALRLGALPAQASVHIDVTLNVRDPAALAAFLAGLGDKKSPYYRHFLHGGQFGALFGPTLAQLAEVEAALRARGLTPGDVNSDRLSIPVTAPAAAIERAFGVSLLMYRLPSGRVAFANSAAPRVPAAIAPLVQGVIGLDDLSLPQNMAEIAPGPKTVRQAASQTPRAAAAGPVPCRTASDEALAADAYTANQLAAHYGLTTLYGVGDLGQGVRIAVAELDPDLASDISTYESCYGIDTTVNYFTVDPGLKPGAGDDEAALDIETIAGLAPDATIDVYQAPGTAITDLYDIMNSVVGKDTDEVLNISYGVCELDISTALMKAYQNIMAAANSKAITVLAATGDSGSTGCYPYDHPKSLSVTSPASADYVDAVGGTTMTGAGWAAKEVVWNDSKVTADKLKGAGGGGISTQCMPAYQDYHQTGLSPIPGVISSLTKTSASCKSTADPQGYLREVPDVSADADPYTGYVFYYDGSWNWYIGGTSAATALMSAEAALIDASPLCGPQGWDSGPAGLLPEGLYERVAADQGPIYNESYTGTQTPFILYDVRSGNNDDVASGYTGGLYPAKKAAYDLASGLGVPLLAGPDIYVAPAAYGLAAEMCFYYGAAGTENISTRFAFPDYARAGSVVTVTVRGTGFLPIPESNDAEVSLKVGSNYAEPSYYNANCSSRTTCTVVLFGLPAGTYGIEMQPGGFDPCNTCKALVQFQFVGAPHVSALSPAKGKHGTKVTISGKNFIGVTAVNFGGTTATSFKVVSPTEIVVTAPPGSGTVDVTVTAVGGTSNAVKFTYT